DLVENGDGQSIFDGVPPHPNPLPPRVRVRLRKRALCVASSPSRACWERGQVAAVARASLLPLREKDRMRGTFQTRILYEQHNIRILCGRQRAPDAFALDGA